MSKMIIGYIIGCLFGYITFGYITRWVSKNKDDWTLETERDLERQRERLEKERESLDKEKASLDKEKESIRLKIEEWDKRTMMEMKYASEAIGFKDEKHKKKHVEHWARYERWQNHNNKMKEWAIANLPPKWAIRTWGQ